MRAGILGGAVCAGLIGRGARNVTRCGVGGGRRIVGRVVGGAVGGQGRRERREAREHRARRGKDTVLSRSSGGWSYGPPGRSRRHISNYRDNKKPRRYAALQRRDEVHRDPRGATLIAAIHASADHGLSSVRCDVRTHPAYLRPLFIWRFLPPAARELVRAAYPIPSFHSVSGRCRSSFAYFSRVNAGLASVVVVLQRV